MKLFNRGEVPLAFGKLLGIKGSLSMQVDESIIPTINLANLIDTPYLQYAIPVQGKSVSAAVAAENGVVVARPGANVALQILQVLFTNDTAAAQIFNPAILTAANIATAVIAVAENMVNTAAQRAGELRSSDILVGTHTALLGSPFLFRYLVAPGTTAIWEVPSPGIILYGNDENGRPGLGVWNVTANETHRVAFVAREWPLPG